MLLRFTYSHFFTFQNKILLKLEQNMIVALILMAAWVSVYVTVKCGGEVVQARQVVQCARECSFAPMLPKIDPSKKKPSPN